MVLPGLLYTDPVPMSLALPAAPTTHTPVTAATILKTGATTLLGGFVSNPSTTTWAFLHCYNLNTTTGFTVGQPAGLITVIHVPIGGTWENDWVRARGPYTTGLLAVATTGLLGTTVVSTPVMVSLDLTAS